MTGDEYFLFVDGPWAGQIQENTFQNLVAPSSLLIAGGPTRYVCTPEHVDLSGGAHAVVYRLDPTNRRPAEAVR